MAKEGITWRLDREGSVAVIAISCLLAAILALISYHALNLIPGNSKEPWDKIVPAVAAGIGALIPASLKRLGQKKDLAEKILRQTTGGPLKRFSELTDRDLRIHSPVRDDSEFLERDIYTSTVELVKNKTPMLVVGPSMSGKSRLVAEAIRAEFPNNLTVIPDSGEDLLTIIDTSAGLSSCVIWLDDAERFLNAGLTAGRMRQLLAKDNIMVGTIRSSEREKFRSLGKEKPQGWDVVALFTELTLSSQLTAEENLRLSKSSYSDIVTPVRQYGLTEYLGGAPEAWSYFVDGVSSNYSGWAIVSAAVDWYRTVRSPISDKALQKLAPNYLSQKQLHSFNWDKGLEWATHPINDTVQLLMSDRGSTWLAFDYIIDRHTIANRPIPDQFWDVVVSEPLKLQQAWLAGAAAFDADKDDVATKLWQRSSKSTVNHVASMSFLGLGSIFDRRNEKNKAMQSYKACLALGEGPGIGTAALCLADIYMDSSNPELAEKSYEHAIRVGESRTQGLALISLGRLFKAQSRDEDAMLAYHRAIATGDSWATIAGLRNLADMYGERGDIKKAVALYLECDDIADLETQQKTALSLGDLYRKAGDTGEAEGAYKRATASSDPFTSGMAFLSLGDISRERGDDKGAVRSWRKAMTAGHGAVTGFALVNLALLYREKGLDARANETYEQAAKLEDSWFSGFALVALGDWYSENNDVQRAFDYYRRASNSSNASAVGNSLLGMGHICRRRGDSRRALELYSRAYEAGDALVQAQAGLYLGKNMDRD